MRELQKGYDIREIMDEKKSVEEYAAELEDIVMLETSLCRQEKIAKAYADYTYIPKEPPQYRNRASLGMISLSVTWVLFDLFAFFMGNAKVAAGASVFTVALILFFIVLQLRGMKANRKLMAEYEEYCHAYELVKLLEEPKQRTRRVLARLYEKSAVYERYRNLNAVCAICDYLGSGRASEIYGPQSVYRLYDKELQRGRVPDKAREIEEGICSVEQIPGFCKGTEHLLDEIEKRNNEHDYMKSKE